ncbi:MAG: fibronectin type III domain-containing protein [Acidobacteriaceae bacterium]
MVRKLPPLVRLGAVATLTVACAFVLQLSLVGCGMEASPQPPSLDLPKCIPDLTANRTGNQVHLEWITPSENTDHLKLKGMVQLRICRQQQEASPCQTTATISAVPDKPAQYTDVLPPALTAGPVRAIAYRVFGLNKRGRTAGPSNAATILAGEAPPEVCNLSAQVVARGVVLRWQPVANLPAGTSIQIDRTLLTPTAPATPTKSRTFNPLPQSREPLHQELRVRLLSVNAQHTAAALHQSGIDPGIALDRTALFGRQYSYTASRVVQRQVDNQTLDLAGSPSQPVQVTTRDTFPPAVPAGLVAVPVSATMNNGQPEVDLSWSANTEPDLAHYRVYRRDVTEQGSVQRIAPQAASGSGSEPIVAPAFRDIHVEPGHTYAFAVTAVDTSGNESPRSAEVSVTVPTS